MTPLEIHHAVLAMQPATAAEEILIDYVRQLSDAIQATERQARKASQATSPPNGIARTAKQIREAIDALSQEIQNDCDDDRWDAREDIIRHNETAVEVLSWVLGIEAPTQRITLLGESNGEEL